MKGSCLLCQGDQWLRIHGMILRSVLKLQLCSMFSSLTVAHASCPFRCFHQVKLLDWGEDGFATESETAALRASFKQEVAVWDELSHTNVTKFVGTSMGTTDLKIPADSSKSGARTELPQRACCVVVKYLAGGTLKQYLIKNF